MIQRGADDHPDAPETFRPSDAMPQMVRTSSRIPISAVSAESMGWTETPTQIASHHVPDELYDRTREHFTEAELVGLTLAVIAINGWNRLAIPFRAEIGSYEPGTAEATAAPPSA